MKIAVTATGSDLDSGVDPRFGRCATFLIVEPESMTPEAVANANTTAGGGAGVQSAQLMADRGVEVVLTGNCGPNAFRTLQAAGIEVVVGVSGTVREALERYTAGELSGTDRSNVGSHFGTGA
jgi:predicted Fe-Mo cluster-binding NifX family protein